MKKLEEKYMVEIVVPPAWAYLRVSGDNKKAVRETLTDAWRSGPRDSVAPYIKKLEKSLIEIADEAHKNGAFAIVMPLGVPWQVPVSTALALAFMQPEGGGAALAVDEDYLVTASGDAALEIIEHLDDADEDSRSDDLVLLRSIEVTWLTPGAEGYLLASATISGLADPLYNPITDALTELHTVMCSSVQIKKAA